MYAAYPATRTILALQQLFAGPLYPAQARCRLLRVIDPANELVTAERREVSPKLEDLWI